MKRWSIEKTQRHPPFPGILVNANSTRIRLLNLDEKMYYPTNVRPNLHPGNPPRPIDSPDARLHCGGDGVQTVPRQIGGPLPVLERNGHDARRLLRRPGRLLSPGESRRGRRPLLSLPALPPPFHQGGSRIRFPRQSGATLRSLGAFGALRSAFLLSSQTPHSLTLLFSVP